MAPTIPIPFPSKPVSPLKNLFQRLDADGDGSITDRELERFATYREWPGSGAVANTLMDAFDSDRDKRVTLDELRGGVSKLLMEFFTSSVDFGDWFQLADANGDGVVTGREMEPLVRQRLIESGRVNPGWPGLDWATKQLAATLASMVDRDGSGGVSRSELADLQNEVWFDWDPGDLDRFPQPIPFPG